MRLSEIKTRLNLECKVWFQNQIKNPYNDYHLYYLEAKPEHNGGFIIQCDAPSNKNYKVALNNRMNKGYTAEQLFNSLMPTINRLPIID